VEDWQDWRTGQPKHLGDLWTLEKKGREALCVLVGHPLGSEARILVDGDLIRSEHFKNGKEMLDATSEWRRAFLKRRGGKGPLSWPTLSRDAYRSASE
jgi:hypothetical protein